MTKVEFFSWISVAALMRLQHKPWNDAITSELPRQRYLSTSQKQRLAKSNFSKARGCSFGTPEIKNYLSYEAHTCLGAETFVSCSWYSNLVIWCSIKIWGRTVRSSWDGAAVPDSLLQHVRCIGYGGIFMQRTHFCFLRSANWEEMNSVLERRTITIFLYILLSATRCAALLNDLQHVVFVQLAFG